MGMRRTFIIDLEATCCDQGTVPRESMEIIEVGGALATEDGDIIETFQSFVRPVEYPVLTTFCTELTSIVQADVANAPLWADVAKQLDDFVRKHKVTEWGGWGRYDRRQIERESKRKRVPVPMARLTHRNIKSEFAHAHQTSKMGMAEAVAFVGLPLHGTYHRGIDDAINIAHLLPWCKLS